MYFAEYLLYDKLTLPFKNHYKIRNKKLNNIIDTFNNLKNSKYCLSKGHNYFGFNNNEFDNKYFTFREFLPSAKNVFLIGDFCDWKIKNKNQLNKWENGIWELIIKKDLLKNYQVIKLLIELSNGKKIYRNPAYSKFLILNKNTFILDNIFIKQNKYKFKFNKPENINSLRIYECHIGISSKNKIINSYYNFKKEILPYIYQLGYNVILLIGICEHAYYPSFGYLVNYYYAISSKFGTINEFKELIDYCHKLKIKVLLDIVFSHASSNEEDGLSNMDGNKQLYFLEGNNKWWKSKNFDYLKKETFRYLISNIRFFIEEYNIDGFRFDGISSILYKNNGFDLNFTGDYNIYFDNCEINNLCFITFINYFIKNNFEDIITIAEDGSGFPGLTNPIEEGGAGFTYRYHMGIPELWFNIVKNNIFNLKKIEPYIFSSLTNIRKNEKYIMYIECHDQCINGSQSLISNILGNKIKNLIDNKDICSQIEYSINFLKTIKLITISITANGYLNFIGNEFGHPFWIEFPNEKNCYSFEYSRRRFDLIDESKNLKFLDILNFEKDLWMLLTYYDIMELNFYNNKIDEENGIITFNKSCFIFIFSFRYKGELNLLNYNKSNNTKFKILFQTNLNNKLNSNNLIYIDYPSGTIINII